MISGYGNIEMVVIVIKYGVYDFIEKFFKLDCLFFLMEWVLEVVYLKCENEILKCKV